jgi:hypothetical protein
MPLYEETESSKAFYRQLAELCLLVQTVPREHRSALAEFAEQIRQQHRKAQNECANIQHLADDIRLFDESISFNLWASQYNDQTRPMQNRKNPNT